jgi:hypothetical protein
MQEVWVLTRRHTHKGAIDAEFVGGGVHAFMKEHHIVPNTPEPCNLDQAVDVHYVQPHARMGLPPFCRRCFHEEEAATLMGD